MSTLRPLKHFVYESYPHVIDDLSYLIQYGNPPSLSHDQGHIVLDRRVVRGVIRHSLGMPMRTFSIGTQLHIESLVVSSDIVEPWEVEKYEHSRQEFTAFADWARENHPQEFLPDEYYEPFRIFYERRE